MNLIYTTKPGIWPTYIRKLLFVMRLTIVITLLTVLQLQAGTSAGQAITYKNNSVTLINLFKEIQTQTGYNMTWNENKIDLSIKVNVNFKNTPIKEALERSLKGLPLTFDVNVHNKSISIKYEEPSILDRIISRVTAIDVRGRVVGENNEPLVGANIKVKGTSTIVFTDKNGEFLFKGIDDKVILVISFLGFETQEIIASKDLGNIKMIMSNDELSEVEIVSTGYQDIPKERVTGSFEKINNETFNRTIGTNVLSRLDGIVNGLYVDKRISGRETFNVRGISTLGGGAFGALIIVDNFPYEGNLDNINPNDVESITVLKDAAATSIWGAKAGNGVIVIKLKKGQFNQPININVNTNITVTEKPNIYNYPQMSSSDFIDIEEFLYANKFYQNDLLSSNALKPVISPVIDILNKRDRLLLSISEADAQIDNLRKVNYRNDVDKYFNQKAISQQYNFSLSGGSNNNSFLLSGGYDFNRSSLIGNNNSRYTIRGVTTLKLIKNLEMNASIGFTQASTKNNGLNSIITGGGKGALYPYAQIVDANGNPLPIAKNFNINYTDTAGKGKLLDWTYRPLNEIRNADNTTSIQDINIGINFKYSFLKGLSAELIYKYEKQYLLNRQYNSEESYFTRNLINGFTQITNGIAKRIIPLGGILDLSNTSLNNNNIRGQISYNKSFSKIHEITALLGSELLESKEATNSNRTYGYNNETISYSNIDFVNQYPVYDNLPTGTNGFIPNNLFFNETLNRTVSVYSNIAYTFDKRYVISASARRDAANIFGVNTNQKWKPLWSIGGSWNLSQEKFYNVNLLTYLRLRATYGFSGNVNNNAVTRSVIRYPSEPATYTNLRYAFIDTPPNPEAKWEQVRMINFGLDFSLKNDIISGSIEYFTKKADDLFASTPIDATTGFNNVIKNVAQINGRGFEFTLNTKNLDKKLKWRTMLSFAYVKDIVSKYFAKPLSSSSYTGSAVSISPLEGYPLYPIFSYKFGGLDPNNGDPMGVYKGENSKAYASLLVDSLKNLNFHGSAIPLYTGFIRNTFVWNQIELSLNITYKLDYYIRRRTINYNSLFNTWSSNADYNKRWQKSGDEYNTNIPSMTFPANSSRDTFFQGSEVNVVKGDHIRLNDIIVRYNLTNQKSRVVKNLQVSLYANNIGIIWKSNNSKIDPDYPSSEIPLQRSLAIGLKSNF